MYFPIFLMLAVKISYVRRVMVLGFALLWSIQKLIHNS